MIFLLLLSSASALHSASDQFESFKLRANKTYSSLAEEQMRFEVFQENLKAIEKHNSEGHTWRMGVTKFADLTRSEFVSATSGRASFPQAPTVPKMENVRVEDLPEHMDWRDKGVITPVMDQ